MTGNDASIKEMVGYLESDMADEFKAITMYREIADRVDDPEVLRLLSIVLVDEIKHLIKVSDQILKLRTLLVGLPGLTNEERQGTGIRDPLSSEEQVNAYLAFMKEERIQQLRYTKQMELAGDDEMKAIFKAIRDDEVKHARIFQEILDKVGAEKQ